MRIAVCIGDDSSQRVAIENLLRCIERRVIILPSKAGKLLFVVRRNWGAELFECLNRSPNTCKVGLQWNVNIISWSATGEPTKDARTGQSKKSTACHHELRPAVILL